MAIEKHVVRFEEEAEIFHITLDDKGKGNPLNPGAIDQLQAALQVAIESPQCRVINIHGQGKVFCSGLDMELFMGADEVREEDCRSFVSKFIECLYTIYSSPKPVVVCIEGKVFGGGLGIVAACDVVLANPGVIFQLPEIVYGVMPLMITPFLLRRMPSSRLRYFALSSQPIDVNKALQFGLVDEIVEKDMKREALFVSKRLLRAGPHAIAGYKQHLIEVDSMGLKEQLRVGQEKFIAWFDNPKTLEGIQCVAEGMTPPWFRQNKN